MSGPHANEPDPQPRPAEPRLTVVDWQDYAGGITNLDKAEAKLRQFPARFLRVDVAGLLHALTDLREKAAVALAGHSAALAVD